MKKTILFTTLVTGLALTTGCGRSTRTDTAATDTTRTDTTMTTASTPVTTTTSTTPPTASTATEIDRAASRAADSVSDAGRTAANSVENAARKTGDAMNRAGASMSAQMTEWRLSSQDLDADLRANREIVRTKSTAGAPTGNVDKSQLKKNVQSKVSAQAASIKDLDVEIDRETEVVLTGEAQSAEQVGQAMGAALSTDGVTKVTSKIKLAK